MSNDENRVSLKSVIAPAFYSIHRVLKSTTSTSIWLKGGRGSTKSSFAAISIIYGIVRDPDANALVFRKVGDTVRTTVLETLLWAISVLKLDRYFSHTKSPAEITYLPTGQKIIMKGLDDPLKIKSIKVKKGYFKFLWFEEGAEFSNMEEIRNVRQSVQRGNGVFFDFITYNPPNDPAAWVNTECEVEEDGKIVHSSTYLDVPHDWLGDKFIDDAEKLKKRDPMKYEHEYMGIAVGRAEQIIFHNKWHEKDFETPETKYMFQGRFFYGADWGFANDPTALVRSYMMIEHGEKNLYIDYEVGGARVELDDIPRLFNKVPDVKRWKIYADCSRPETISHIRHKGYNIDGAPKWSGSVEDGVEYLLSFDNIYIHPRCVKTIEEFKKYSYKVDKVTQEILPVIVDDWNHYIDALRYSLADYITANVSILDVL